jgi:pimeloyl-ACP methyl ester carboxylesterase
MIATNRSRQTTVSSFDGTRIAVLVVDPVDADADTQTVILVHGFVVNAEINWGRPGIVNDLTAAGLRVLAPDLRAHGTSEAPLDAKRYRNHALARDVMAVASAFDVAAYHLVGYSLGAITAAHVAGTLGDSRVRSLVLGGMGDCLLDPAWSRPPALRDALLGTSSPDTWDSDTRGFMDFIERLGANREPLGLVQGGHDHLRAEHRSWSAPTMVLCGADDTVNGSPSELASALSNAVSQIVPGDHLSALQSVDFRQALVSWLSQRE